MGKTQGGEETGRSKNGVGNKHGRVATGGQEKGHGQIWVLKKQMAKKRVGKKGNGKEAGWGRNSGVETEWERNMEKKLGWHEIR